MDFDHLCPKLTDMNFITTLVLKIFSSYYHLNCISLQCQTEFAMWDYVLKVEKFVLIAFYVLYDINALHRSFASKMTINAHCIVLNSQEGTIAQSSQCYMICYHLMLSKLHFTAISIALL